MDPSDDEDSDSDVAEVNAREDMAREIEVRLSVRRKAYRAALVVLALVTLGVSLSALWLNLPEWGYVLAASAAAIVGMAVVFFAAYVVRKSALYEKAGRSILREP